MKRIVLLTCMSALLTVAAFSQAGKFWTPNNESRSNIALDKAASRASYPKEFKLFNLDLQGFNQALLAIAGNNRKKLSAVISLPNANGGMEDFELVEASNFEPALQARFPAIRGFSGKGITDKYATVKLSISPEGIESMIFRTGDENEFIEAYSADHTVYSVYKANREKARLPWTCSTEDKGLVSDLNGRLSSAALSIGSSTGTLKTLRLAQSCNGEYANYFQAFSSADVAKVLTAFNNTLSRCNGVFETDLGVHLNLIDATTNVIFYDPATDPYSTTISAWNKQLQTTLTNVIGEANYDIGHMFGASGGGGNAGCIGCVCVDGSKGSGITSPADGVPKGDNFDIDYVVHEMGHQLGANHTFSMSSEGTGQQKEVGSGITIMGYAGITSYDVAPHSIAIFHETSIAQIQANLATKTCPQTVDVTGANTPPTIGPVSNYTIPISTPFALTTSATDVQHDVLTYCWEQNDNSNTTGAGSVASPTKTTGPNWLSFMPTTTPTRLFPQLATILAGANVTGPLPGGDAGANIEALSSVSRTLNFRLTVRDNHVYNPTTPEVGQTSFKDVVVTVTNTAGPFAVTSPNTNITWPAGGSAAVTWSVNGTNAGTVNCQSVNIWLSTDGGNTFPTLLATAPNSGSATVTVPNTPGTTNRIKVESVGNIFFDISNTNFTIGGSTTSCGDPTGLASSSIAQTSATVSWNAVSGATSYGVDYMISPSGSWTSAGSTTGTSFGLTGLTPSTVYNWRVKATCSSIAGNYVQSSFTTASTASTCPGTYDLNPNNTTGTAQSIPVNTDVFGTIGSKGDVDYYSFSVSTAGSVTISLTNLPADYQLALVNSAGTTLQTSANSGTTGESITATLAANTVYYAKVYGKNNSISNASSCYILRVQSATGRMVPDVFVKSPLFVSPNPAASKATLRFGMAMSGTATVSVINQTGAVVVTKTIGVNAGDNSKELDLSTLATGIYFVRLQANGSSQMVKLVVAK